MAIFYHTCKSSSQWATMIQRLAAARPPTLQSPWHIILYADEVVPGNQLAYENRRKLWAVYWSIRELGNAVLADEVVHQHNTTLPVVNVRPIHCDSHGCDSTPVPCTDRHSITMPIRRTVSVLIVWSVHGMCRRINQFATTYGGFGSIAATGVVMICKDCWFEVVLARTGVIERVEAWKFVADMKWIA